jgi:hypothetical protein
MDDTKYFSILRGREELEDRPRRGKKPTALEKLASRLLEDEGSAKQRVSGGLGACAMTRERRRK